jgi:hypothetical protein
MPDSKESIAAAAANASKPGKHTTELWASILAPALTAAGMTALKVLGGAAVVSMPWLAIPVAAAAAGISAYGYSVSRGNVKKAALLAAANEAIATAVEKETK